MGYAPGFFYSLNLLEIRILDHNMVWTKITAYNEAVFFGLYISMITSRTYWNLQTSKVINFFFFSNEQKLFSFNLEIKLFIIYL
jgi:hypothetical protein